MTKIQIIIDDEKSLKALTCTGVTAETLTPDPQEIYIYGYERIPKSFHFNCANIISDDSPNLISLPDEVLLRIRDHNIDVEHQNAINETCELTKKIIDLKAQVSGWELRRDLAMEDWEKYNKKIIKIIDKYPRVAAEIALEDGDLDAACYFAQLANEEEEDETSNT